MTHTHTSYVTSNISRQEGALAARADHVSSRFRGRSGAVSRSQLPQTRSTEFLTERLKSKSIAHVRILYMHPLLLNPRAISLASAGRGQRPFSRRGGLDAPCGDARRAHGTRGQRVRTRWNTSWKFETGKTPSTTA